MKKALIFLALLLFVAGCQSPLDGAAALASVWSIVNPILGMY